MLLLFTLTFVCWAASAVDVTHHDDIDLERPLWSQYDPRLVGELVFAVANLLAVIRLLFFFQITQAIGPLQVASGQRILTKGRIAGGGHTPPPKVVPFPRGSGTRPKPSTQLT